MSASTALGKLALIDEGKKLLGEKVYSVAELEEFRKKVKNLRESAARFSSSQPCTPEVSTRPQDLLDWASVEKASVEAIQAALLSSQSK